MSFIAAALAILLASGALYQFIGARRSARRHPAPGRIVDVTGERLHIVCFAAMADYVVNDA
jgi:hypothetical protein